MRLIHNYEFRIKQLKMAFTAIEMIVVLGVVAILVAALVPTISQYLPGVQLSGSTRTLTGDLREAQEKAVTEQDQYLIRFIQLENPPIYEMVKITREIDPETQEPIEEKIREEQLPGNIKLTLEPSPADNQIAFSPDGGPSSSTTITLSLNGSDKKINVSHAGFIKIE